MSDTPTAKGLPGAWRIGWTVKQGIITTIITGSISPWVSFISVQAEPMAMKTDPKKNTARKRKSRNQRKIPRGTASA